MKTVAALLRLAAAACALYLAGVVFYQPLSALMPAQLAETLEQVPGVGASGGFVVQILSEPTGVEVLVDGESRGTTPFFGNVICRQGEEVILEVKAEGRKPWIRKVGCQEEGTLQATARLERAP